GPPPRLAEVRVSSPSEIRWADGIAVRGVPPLREGVWKGGYRSSPPPIYTKHGAFMKPRIVLYNRRPRPEPTEMGVAKCVCCCRLIRQECGYDRACGGDRRRRSDGDDAGG